MPAREPPGVLKGQLRAARRALRGIGGAAPGSLLPRAPADTQGPWAVPGSGSARRDHFRVRAGPAACSPPPVTPACSPPPPRRGKGSGAPSAPPRSRHHPRGHQLLQQWQCQPPWPRGWGWLCFLPHSGHPSLFSPPLSLRPRSDPERRWPVPRPYRGLPRPRPPPRPGSAAASPAEGGGGNVSEESGRNSLRLARGGWGGSELFSLFSLFFFSLPFYSSPEATQQRVTGARPPAEQDSFGTGRVCMRRAPSLPPPPASRPPDHSIPGELCTAVPARGIAAALPIRQGLSNHLPLPPSPFRSLYFIFTCSLLTRLFLNPARIYFSLSLSFSLIFLF